MLRQIKDPHPWVNVQHGVGSKPYHLIIISASGRCLYKLTKLQTSDLEILRQWVLWYHHSDIYHIGLASTMYNMALYRADTENVLWWA